jgi:hypothetical protein
VIAILAGLAALPTLKGLRAAEPVASERPAPAREADPLSA